jgi:hypothetical protein
MIVAIPPPPRLTYCITSHPVTGQTCFLELTNAQFFSEVGDDFSVDLSWEVNGEVFVESVQWSTLGDIKPEPVRH